MSVAISPVFNQAQYFDNNGYPLAGGKIFTYQAGSNSILQTTYTNSSGNVANSNPMVLDSSGRPPQQFWLTDGYSYHFVLTLSDGTTVLQSVDNVSGSTSASGSVTSVNVSATGTGLTTSGGPVTSSGTINIGGILNITNGGTGSTTASSALNALGGVPITGTGATGTWGISVSGNAATATNATSAGKATNIANGAAFQIPYQSSANTTAFIPAPSSPGQLNWTGSNFTWANPGTSINPNGYVTLPGGIIMQWGTVAGIPVHDGANVSFPMVFPNNVFNFQVSANMGGAGVFVDAHPNFNNLTLSGATVYPAAVFGSSGGTATINWLAIGY